MYTSYNFSMQSFMALCSLRQAHANENVRWCAHFVKARKKMKISKNIMKVRSAFYVHFKCQISLVQGTPRKKEGGFQDRFKSHRATTFNIHTSLPCWGINFSSYPWLLNKIALTPEGSHKIWVLTRTPEELCGFSKRVTTSVSLTKNISLSLNKQMCRHFDG